MSQIRLPPDRGGNNKTHRRCYTQYMSNTIIEGWVGWMPQVLANDFDQWAIHSAGEVRNPFEIPFYFMQLCLLFRTDSQCHPPHMCPLDGKLFSISTSTLLQLSPTYGRYLVQVVR
jgi:hypothetical protein